MDYPTLIRQYLGSRSPEQLQNDIKNLQTFEERGGNPEELLKATRAKIFSQSTATAQKGLETLQQQPAPSPYASSIRALKGFEQELGVPQAETAFETAQQQFQKLQREQQLAPGVSRTIFKEKVPMFAESMEDMVAEYTNPDSPNYIQDIGTITKLVSQRLDAQRSSLGDMLSMVNSIYSASTQAAQTATTERRKELDSLKQTAAKMYDDFIGLQRKIDEEQRELGTFEKQEAIKFKYESALETIKAGLKAPSTQITPGATEKEESQNLRNIILSLSAGQQDSAFAAIGLFPTAKQILDLLDKIQTGPIAGRKVTGLSLPLPFTDKDLQLLPGKQTFGTSTTEENQFVAATTAFTANFIKAISGVQVSDRERQFLMNALPDILKQETVNKDNIKILLDFIKNKYQTQLGINFEDYPNLLPLPEGSGAEQSLLSKPENLDFVENAKSEGYSDKEIEEFLKKKLNKVSYNEGARTDRHNNPTAFTTDIAKQAGLKEGKDYIAGDPFPENPNMKTATILGDPIDTTIKVIDKIGFYTASGQPRWTHTKMSKQSWNALSYEQKKNMIKKMYKAEGGKELLSAFG